MGAFYGNKIKNVEINPKTGKAWELGDVPAYRKEATERWLKSH